jgi:tetratricopeptide (TPR) repeat protein
MARSITNTNSIQSTAGISSSETSSPGTSNLGISSPWLYNPWLDLLVGCGAWSAPLLLFWYLSNSAALAWSATFYGLAIFFNYPHYMATLYRAYHTSEDFRKYRIFTVHITGLILLTLILSHFWYRALPWLFTIYLTWSPWHYSGQNYGLFMMFARRAGAKPSETVRQVLYSAFLCSYLILFLTFHTGASQDPLFISLGIPEKISLPIIATLAIAFIVFATLGLSRLGQQIGWRGLLPSLTLFSTQFLWFLLPTALALAEGLRITQSRYSNGVLAVMHSAQYLWITSYYARREASAGSGKTWRPFAYFGVLIAGGMALFVPGPWIASRVFHYDLTASFLLFSALVNIHHFILDGAIWKLRDGRIAALLLNSRQQLSKSTSEAGSRLAAVARWLISAALGPRILRVSAALLLLAWGTVDQVHYYLALHQDNLADLQRAATLASFDSSVQTQLGRKEFADGQIPQAIVAWQQALRSNPAAIAPRDALLRYLASQKRFNEAYVLAGQSLQYAPKDVNLLVNYGILAEQMSHDAQAVESWKQAISLDPAQPLAHLYLANELDREQQWAAAAPQYMIFLQEIAKARGQNRFPPENTIAVALRLAECQQKANHPEQAEKSYELAQKLAAQVGQKKLESLASVSEAGLESQQKKTAQALRLYQRALTLDGQSDDRQSEAADWYSYGIFLRDAGFPPQLAYACLVESGSLIHSVKNATEMQDAEVFRKELEIKIPTQASTIRRDPQPALEEALRLAVP